MSNPTAWEQVLNQFESFCKELKPDLIVGIESRGFIIASAISTKFKLGFVPVRKQGKLPGEVIKVSYELEYGNDVLEINTAALGSNKRVLIFDDLLATGGTAKATSELITKAGGVTVGFGFIVELIKLRGRLNLPKDIPSKSLIKFH